MAETKDDGVDEAQTINIIDTHIHLWKLEDTIQRDWLSSPGIESIHRTFDIHAYYQMFNSQSTAPFLYLKCGIFMETDPHDSSIETEVAEVTKLCLNPNHNLRAMIVKLDPMLTQNEFMHRFQKLKQNPFIVGFRRVLLDCPEKIPKTFIDNIRVISEDKTVHWPFDVGIKIEDLHKMQAVIEALPQQMFVLDHMANHHQICGNAQLRKAWKQCIEQLSKYRNVCIKISALSGGQPGLKMTKPWSFEMEQETIDFVTGTFSDDRIVYGSDWPVSLVPLKNEERANFLRLWTLQIYQYLFQKKGKTFCDKVFVDNAIKIYRLKL